MIKYGSISMLHHFLVSFSDLIDMKLYVKITDNMTTHNNNIEHRISDSVKNTVIHIQFNSTLQ